MKQNTEAVTATAREDGLIIQEVQDEVLVYDLVRHKAHCLNQTAALIWKHCDGKTTVRQMVDLLEREAECDVDAEIVWMALDQLAKARLLRNQETAVLGMSKMSRRTVLQKLGAAAAISLPLVTSIVAPNAVEAISCSPSGSACTASAQCCTGICSGGTCA